MFAPTVSVPCVESLFAYISVIGKILADYSFLRRTIASAVLYHVSYNCDPLQVWCALEPVRVLLAANVDFFARCVAAATKACPGSSGMASWK